MSENPIFIHSQSEAESSPELSDEEKKATEKELFEIDKQIFDLEEELGMMNEGLKLHELARTEQKPKKKLSSKEKEADNVLSKKNLENIDMIKEGRNIAVEQLKELQKKQAELAVKLGPEHMTGVYGMLDEVKNIKRELKHSALDGGRIMSEESYISPEHLSALSEVFKGETLDKITLPKPEELTDEYFAKMYPKTKRKEDEDRGLVSYRPSWWNDPVDASIIGSAAETWGQAYIRSMKAESENFQNAVFFTESIQKPNYKDGSQKYGTKKGVNATKDPLFPLIKEVFGDKANRFSLSGDQITSQLLPKVEAKIIETFTNNHLSIPKFNVILTPAIVSNIQTTLNHPANSQTNTFELTYTILLKQDKTDSGNRLVVGRSEVGGAGYVNDYHRGARWPNGGFRLSVVFVEK